jgi:hypothetical protein
MSPNHWFSPPVCIWLRDGRRRNVTRVVDAAELLLHSWPQEAKNGPIYTAALEACYQALAGNGSNDAVRGAFELAAASAGNLCTIPSREPS